MVLGIIFGIFVAILNSIDTLMNKSLMSKTSATVHSILRILFVIPYLGAVAFLNWNIEKESIPLLIIYGVIESLNILCHQLAIKSLNPIHAEIVSKSKVFFVYIISIFFIIESISIGGIIGLVLFFIGLLLTIDYKKYNTKYFTDTKGYIYELISVISRSVKPFILRTLLVNKSISNETMAFISMVIALIILSVIFRPQIDFKKIEIKKYALQALLVSISMILSGYTILYTNEIISGMLENCSVLFVLLFGFIIYKNKPKLKACLGALFVIIGASIVI